MNDAVARFVEGDKEIGPWYRIVNETGEDYLYPADGFEIVEE